MKKLFQEAVCGGVWSLVASTVMVCCMFVATGCDGGNVITSVSNDVQAVKHFTQGRGVVIQTVEHEGHKYIVVTGNSGVAVLHDPACEATNRKQGSVGSPVGAAATE